MTVRLTVLCLILYIVLVILSNGCLAPPIVFPKTGASGIVVDQERQPLTNAQVEAVWYAVRIIKWYEPLYTRKLEVGEDGSWDVSARKVDRMIVYAYAPSGYEPPRISMMLKRANIASSVVFQFHKIQPAELPKESK